MFRIVVKGGGHSFHGGSNAAGSLLIWTRPMNAIEVHDAFTPAGSDAEPMPAVSVSAGALWGEVYRKVCAGAGRYVQAGGCLTVGLAGLFPTRGFPRLSNLFRPLSAPSSHSSLCTE